MPQEMDEDALRRLSTLERQYVETKAESTAIARILRRVLDMDEGSTLDREMLLTLRDALAYAVKMKRREAEIDDLLLWVRHQKANEHNRKASVWANARILISGLFGAVASAIAMRYFGPVSK